MGLVDSDARFGWPLPPLRPKRSAYGVAGLPSGIGQRDSHCALMTQASASESAQKPIPLNM